MDKALSVRRVERRGDLSDNGHGSRWIERAPVDQALQVCPPDQPHIDEQAAIDLSESMNRDDVRFLQLRRGVRLSLEPHPVFAVVCELAFDDL